MNDRPPYIFSQEHWTSIAVFAFVPGTIISILMPYYGIAMAGLIGIAIGIMGFILVRRKIMTTAVFNEDRLVLQKGIFYKQRDVDYVQIHKLSYVVD